MNNSLSDSLITTFVVEVTFCLGTVVLVTMYKKEFKKTTAMEHWKLMNYKREEGRTESYTRIPQPTEKWARRLFEMYTEDPYNNEFVPKEEK